MSKIFDTSKMTKNIYYTGILVTVLIIIIAFIDFGFLHTLELKLLDWRFSLRGAQKHTNQVVIVSINDASIKKIGKWPWKRSIFGDLVNKLHKAGAKVVAFDIYFQKDDGDTLSEDNLKFVEACKNANNVILPIYFNLNKEEQVFEGSLDEKDFAFLKTSGLDQIEDFATIRGYDLFASFPQLNKAAYGAGHINILPDNDGITRKEIFSIAYKDLFFPSLSLRAVQKYFDEKNPQLELVGGEGISVGTKFIPIEPIPMGGAMVWGVKYINYRGLYKTFTYYSFADVLQERFPSDAFAGKIVLVGATSPGLYDLISIPYSNVFPGVERHANVIDNILEGDFITAPIFSDFFTILLCLGIGLFFTFVIAPLTAVLRVASTIVFTIFYVSIAAIVFAQSAIWINITYPVLCAWFVSLTTFSLFYKKTKKERELAILEREHAKDKHFEASKMLGLAFQEKGMLEAAYEHFSKLPLDKNTLPLLFNLANDLQRKRKEALAIQIYKKIYQIDKNFEDVGFRLSKLGVSAVRIEQDKATSTLSFVEDESQEKVAEILKEGQTLGRYEIVKALGQGAMGIVYLAIDPTLDRKVALKTFNFSSHFDANQLDSVKASFIKEAQMAGKMNHLNIVTIFDAGEDWDLSYIAMEVLKGIELKEYCEKSRLLPEANVVEIMITLALALDYAHTNGVIHRDIKPANIMVVENDIIKITDFGIAMGTGEIAKMAGTPAYMAPEQFEGDQVDNRTDLYALGIVMFEMLTGKKPFVAPNIDKLKEKVINDPVPEIENPNQSISPALKHIVKKLLEKDKRNRFASGNELARALEKLNLGMSDETLAPLSQAAAHDEKNENDDTISEESDATDKTREIDETGDTVYDP